MALLKLSVFLCVLLHSSLSSSVTPASCRDAKQNFPESGVRTLHIYDNRIVVYCDQTTDGGGWTVIQRRENGAVDFYRGWDDYVRGFGNLTSEYWLGLENIHILTKNQTHELRVDMWDFGGDSAFAKYGRFKIEGQGDKYRIRVSAYNRNSTAGDSLTWHNNMAFSTRDRDNDRLPGSCAKSFRGAWWYRWCHASNLNGRYKTMAESTDGVSDGIIWYRWKNENISLKKVEMKIRPA